MSRLRNITVLAVVGVTACALTMQSVAHASPSRSAAPDGGGPASATRTYHGETPLQVRNGAATLVGRLPAGQHLRLSIGLNVPHLAAVERFNRAVQTKKSPLFHHYLTAKQWNARFAPSAATQAKVVRWARSNRLTVTHLYPNHLLVDVDGTAAQVQAALHVSLNRYSLHGKTFFSNSRNPVLPASLRSVVATVDGLNNIAKLSTDMPAKSLAKQKTYSPGPVVSSGASAHSNGSRAALRAAMKQHARPSITGGSYDPTDIYSSQAYDTNALYHESSCCNPQNNSGSSPPNTSIAIATVGNQATSDMQGFQARYSYLAYDFNEVNIDGAPSCCDGEGTMDLEWSTALSNSFGSFASTAHVWLYDGVNSQISTFDDIYNQMLTDGNAKIVTSSWGCAEDTCYTGSEMDFDHNSIFNAMIGQGYTLLNASDDHGAYADCTSTKRVQYPASDPDFLAISATNLELDTNSNYVSEGAWQGNSAGCVNNGGGGGGGCSDHFAAPSYQLSPSNPNYFCGTANGFSQNFKTVPDVSLNGDWLNSPQNLYFNGSFQGNGGTSIASPEMAGFYAQQNSYLLTLGNVCGGGSSACAPIGQAGRQMYLAALDHAAQGKNPYYDITSGCTTNNAGSGFCGIAGYDRATGWGTMNMLQLAWANNYWSSPEASPPTVTMSGPAVNTYANSGTLSWTIADNGSPPSGVSGWTAQWGSDPGDPSTEPHPGAGNSFYSGPASAHGSTSGSVPLSSDGNGCHTLFVRAWDNIGESSVNSYGPVCYDATAPVTVTGTSHFVRGTQIAAGKVPVQIAWSGSDTGGSGLKNFTLWQSTDGASFSEIATPTTTTQNVMLAAGHTYQFAVNAVDNAGNTGAFVFEPKFKLQAVQEAAPAITYAGVWTLSTDSTASGGKLKFTTAKNASAKYKFTGRSIAWVGGMATNRGSASVQLDSTPATADNTHATTTKPRVLLYVHNMTNGPHTLLITNSATAGHPRIDVDAFVVMVPA
jgi:kumamolisin